MLIIKKIYDNFKNVIIAIIIFFGVFFFGKKSRKVEEEIENLRKQNKLLKNKIEANEEVNNVDDNDYLRQFLQDARKNKKL